MSGQQLVVGAPLSPVATPPVGDSEHGVAVDRQSISGPRVSHGEVVIDPSKAVASGVASRARLEPARARLDDKAIDRRFEELGLKDSLKKYLIRVQEDQVEGEPEFVGKGSYNRVVRLRLKTEVGCRTAVFKELVRLKADTFSSVTGIPNGEAPAGRNLAAAAFDKLLGFGLVPHTDLCAIHLAGQLTIGLLMDEAPGGRMHKAIQMRPELLREPKVIEDLINLQWLDHAMANLDRHFGNYMVHPNPAKATSAIAGIDHDFSFGSKLTHALDISRERLKHFSGPTRLPEFVGTGTESRIIRARGRLLELADFFDLDGPEMHAIDSRLNDLLRHIRGLPPDCVIEPGGWGKKIAEMHREAIRVGKPVNDYLLERFRGTYVERVWKYLLEKHPGFEIVVSPPEQRADGKGQVESKAQGKPAVLDLPKAVGPTAGELEFLRVATGALKNAKLAGKLNNAYGRREEFLDLTRHGRKTQMAIVNALHTYPFAASAFRRAAESGAARRYAVCWFDDKSRVGNFLRRQPADWPDKAAPENASSIAKAGLHPLIQQVSRVLEELSPKPSPDEAEAVARALRANIGTAGKMHYVNLVPSFELLARSHGEPYAQAALDKLWANQKVRSLVWVHGFRSLGDRWTNVRLLWPLPKEPQAAAAPVTDGKSPPG